MLPMGIKKCKFLPNYFTVHASRVFFDRSNSKCSDHSCRSGHSFHEEDGLLLPEELIIQSLPQPTFKYQVLQLCHCSGASSGFTEHANTKTTLIVLWGGSLEAIWVMRLAVSSSSQLNFPHLQKMLFMDEESHLRSATPDIWVFL